MDNITIRISEIIIITYLLYPTAALYIRGAYGPGQLGRELEAGEAT